jgi:hypothetical protein
MPPIGFVPKAEPCPGIFSDVEMASNITACMENSTDDNNNSNEFTPSIVARPNLIFYLLMYGKYGTSKVGSLTIWGLIMVTASRQFFPPFCLGS